MFISAAVADQGIWNREADYPFPPHLSPFFPFFSLSLPSPPLSSPSLPSPSLSLSPLLPSP